MAATPYSLRYLANKVFYDNEKLYDMAVPFQSNLEKGGRAMRYAMKTVQYYSPRYDYRDVVYNRNDETKRMFEHNELGK